MDEIVTPVTPDKSAGVTRDGPHKASVYGDSEKLLHLLHLLHPKQNNPGKPAHENGPGSCPINFSYIYTHNDSMANPEKNTYIYSKSGVTGVTGVTKNEEAHQKRAGDGSKMLHPNLIKGVTGVTDLPKEAQEDINNLLGCASSQGLELTVEHIEYVGFPEELAEAVLCLLHQHKLMDLLQLASELSFRGKGHHALKDPLNGWTLFPWFSLELKTALCNLHAQGQIEFFWCEYSVYEKYGADVLAKLRRHNWRAAAVGLSGWAERLKQWKRK